MTTEQRPLKELLLEEQLKPATLHVSRPSVYGVDYEINPWMIDKIGTVDLSLAKKQWLNLVYHLEHAGAYVHQADPSVIPFHLDNAPDAVFIANAGSFLPKSDGSGDYIFLPSRFAKQERVIEQNFFEDHFSWHRHEIIRELHPGKVLPSFEGDGDLLRAGDYLVVGYGHRTSEEFVKQLCAYYTEDDAQQIIPVRLVDPRFYHLDTCFFWHGQGDASVGWFYPEAFDRASRLRLEDMFNDLGTAWTFLDESEAIDFSANAVGIQECVIAHKLSGRLQRFLDDENFIPLETDLSEYLKAGGSAKCLTIVERRSDWEYK